MHWMVRGLLFSFFAGVLCAALVGKGFLSDHIMAIIVFSFIASYGYERSQQPPPTKQNKVWGINFSYDAHKKK